MSTWWSWQAMNPTKGIRRRTKYVQSILWGYGEDLYHSFKFLKRSYCQCVGM